MRMKLKMHWRAQTLVEARTTKCLRNAIKSEQSQTKRETVRATVTDNNIWAGSFKSFEVCISPQLDFDAGHRARGFNVCPAGSRACFGSPGFYSPISPFLNEDVYPLPLYVSSVNCPLTFYRVSQL